MLRLLGRIVPAKKRARFVPNEGVAFEVEGRTMVVGKVERHDSGAITVTLVSPDAWRTVVRIREMLKRRAGNV